MSFRHSINGSPSTRGTTVPKNQMLLEDRVSLLPLPKNFEAAQFAASGQFAVVI
jgi:hypothetical protein